MRSAALHSPPTVCFEQRLRMIHRRRRASAPPPAAEPDEAPSSSPQSPTRPKNSPPPAPTPPNPLSSPTDLVSWGGRLPSRRRLLISGAASTSIVLAGNFGGFTSFLLSSTDEAAALARRLRLDVLYPVRGYKRAIAPDGGGYEFIYPRSWLADQTIARRRAAAAELSRPAIFEGPAPSSAVAEARRRRAASARSRPPGPEVAFGPAGSSGETNVSVVVAPIEPGFDLRQLGTPREAGEEFLSKTVAPPGSGRTAELLRAEERTGGDDERTGGGDDERTGGGGGDERTGGGGGTLYYEFEYRVTGPDFDRLNVSAFAGRGGDGGGVVPELVTLNAQAPWSDARGDRGLADALRRCARSLEVGRRVPGASYGAGARPF